MDAAFSRRNGLGFSTLALALALAGCGGFGKMATQQPDQNRPSLLAARGALSEGEAETALGIARGVLAMEPHNVAAMVAAGDADNQLGNHRQAQHDYEAALKADPGYTPARLGLAKLAMRNDAAEAERMFRTILALEPRNAAVLTDLGVALDLQGRHKDAQGVYAQALATNTDLTSTRVDLALSLALSGEPIKAEGMLRDATEGGTVPAKVRADYALAEVLSGHADEAQQTLKADLTDTEAKESVEAMSALMPPKK